jgi:hypothetical protein
MAINYFLQSKKNPAPIYVRIREYSGIDAKARTKYSINPKLWSTSKGQPKNLADEEFKKLHEDLISFKAKLNARLNKRQPNETINTQWLKDYINPPPVPESLPDGLVKYFDKYVDFKKSSNEITASSIKKINVFKQLVSRYESTLRQEIKISHVNLAFQNNFENYCRDNKYAPNTIAMAVRYIKTMCRHARINGIETHQQLDGITSKGESVKHIYLSFEELEKIENKKIPENLEDIRDWLIISCYTGQRISDFMRFTKEMIRVADGKQYIEFTQEKTKKIMTLPLHKKVIAILNKHDGDFPKALSDQKYNDYIKDVCSLVGLKQKVEGSIKRTDTQRKETGSFEKFKLVCSHIGRRSFATNFYGKIPTPLLMAATGHTTEKMFLRYIGKSDATNAQELSKAFDDLEHKEIGQNKK